MAVELNGSGDTTSGLDQVERDVAADVAPLGGAPATSAKKVAKRPFAENVAEGGEDVVHILEVGRAPTGSVDAGMAVPVVTFAAFGIVEHLERLGRFLETDDHLVVARVFVRMISDRQLAISVGNLLRRGSAADTQDFVIIAFFRHCRHGTHGSSGVQSIQL